ncbi:MAG TPA: hypothetical protein VN821_02805 [Candidatus Udaeobacter sp.]|nr:hypothetical protein [Candidatus Udaeobacter sp.]
MAPPGDGARYRSMMPWRKLIPAGLLVLSGLLGGIDGASAQDAQVVPPAPDLRGAAVIQIRDASYGHTGTLADCTVTEAVKRVCEGRLRCVLDVDDRLCPPPQQIPRGLILTLSVRYRCESAGPTHFQTADKPFQLIIACGAGKL